jgi:hypothetical protein
MRFNTWPTTWPRVRSLLDALPEQFLSESATLIDTIDADRIHRGFAKDT